MYCSKCGKEIDDAAVICPSCGCATANFNAASKSERPKTEQPQIIINNSNENFNANIAGMDWRKPKKKWTAFFLCLFLGYFGAHKFYEGKTGMGILYLFTAGIGGIGVMIDLIVLLFKPRYYYV